MMRNIFKFVPLLFVPNMTTKTFKMEQGQQFNPAFQQQHQEGIDKQIDQTQIPIQSQAILQQQSKQLDQKQSKQIDQNQTKEQQLLTSDNSVEPQKEVELVEEIVETKQQITQQIHQMLLKDNQAIVNDKCPSHIIDFLHRTNHKIVRSSKSKSELIIKNSKGDILKMNMQMIIQQNKDELQIVSNFINPPQEISTIQQAKQILKSQQRDTFYIVSYLPKQEEYDIQTQQKNKFDTYSPSRQVNLPQLENTFASLAYNSSSNKNTYFIVRNKSVADYLRINHFHVGVPYIINKTTKESGNESNNQWQGNRYLMTNLSKQMKDKMDGEIINKTTHLYINKIGSQAQAYNKIRQMQMAGDKRRILLVYSKQRQEFQDKVESILQKVGRTQKNSVVILKAQNEQLLKTIFKVQPQQYTTIRLFDVNKLQAPLFASSKASTSYSRYQYKGAFKYQNLCDFVKDNSLSQYYENKKNLTFIKPVSAQQLKKLDNTLVILEKEGCQSCSYVQRNLDELKRIKKILTLGNPKLKQNLIYRYNIQDPQSLQSLKIRRYSIFNESLNFTPPTATPRLYIFSQGKYVDLNIGQSLQKMKSVKQQQLNQLNSFLLKEMINKIRRSEHSAFIDL